MPDIDDPTAAPNRWTFSVDKRDLLAASGGALIIVGAAAIHWALALIAVGVALAALSWRLSRSG